ncbi:hypothetical protein FJY93_03515 [Candidatus Kaiserbacteria bacterium]|nr:hypothetical protein [Candidatus Kaiserbacteria bacterium]
MAQDELRMRVRQLRKQGTSIKSIAKILDASTSTVSYWCRDIKLSESQIRKLAKNMERGGMIGRLRAAEKKRAQRLLAIQKETSRGKKDISILTKRDMFIVGLALYWGEGYKNGNDECGLTNTDPIIIKAFIHWLFTMYGVTKDDLILRVTINDTHRARAHIIETYWSQQTSIPLSQFTQTSFIRSTSIRVFENPNGYVGTLRVKVRRSTALRRRILGSISEIKQQILNIGSS